MALRLRDVASYVLSRAGCLHPFYISRIIALFELTYFEEHGVWPVDAGYVGGPGVFYIDGFKEIIEGDRCFRKREGDPERGIHGCIEYVCSPPRLPSNYITVLDGIIDKAVKMDMRTLNSVVVGHRLYHLLLKKNSKR